MHDALSGLWLFIKGVAMGIADLIPGVSGGTIALITGIYDKLLESIGAISLKTLKSVFKGDFSACWKEINGNFLMSVGSGILFGVICFTSLIHYMLQHHSMLLWSFFFGLIIVSFIIVVKNTPKKGMTYLTLLMAGAFVAFFMTEMTPAMIEKPTMLMLFISGSLAICAMLLPGISGSFILLLMGVYDAILSSLVQFHVSSLLIFFSGCIFGLLLFSRAIHWLLKHYYTRTLGFLSGLMLGSLYKIWPWKKYILSDSGLLSEAHVSPWFFAETSGTSQLLLSLACLCLGVILVLILQFFFSSSMKKE